MLCAGKLQHYLPPVLSMEDIQSTTAQEWISLLQQIIDYSNYDVVILDLSDSVSQLYKVLEQCTRIYMPIRADPVRSTRAATAFSVTACGPLSIRIWRAASSAAARLSPGLRRFLTAIDTTVSNLYYSPHGTSPRPDTPFRR